MARRPERSPRCPSSRAAAAARPRPHPKRRGRRSARWPPAPPWARGCSSPAEPDFPPALAAIDPPPPLIWARGQTELLARPAVAIVGARIASAAGQRFARGLASELGQAGYAIVSGMARGIDAAAHEGSLATGSIAVLAGGVDDVYPAGAPRALRASGRGRVRGQREPAGHGRRRRATSRAATA